MLVNPNEDILEKIKNLNFDYYQLYNVSPKKTKIIKKKYNKKIITAINVKKKIDIYQYKKYLRHVYVRTNESYTFKHLPITRIYVQFKSLEFYFEDRKVQVINFGEKRKFMFFYDASQEGNYFEITEEEFFKA